MGPLVVFVFIYFISAGLFCVLLNDIPEVQYVRTVAFLWFPILVVLIFVAPIAVLLVGGDLARLGKLWDAFTDSSDS